MKKRILFFSGLLFLPTFAYGACSVNNLTKCLDSVCAINIGANPAARCQYCGSSSAGEPKKSTAMKSVSAGSSTKYIISDKELKKAPSDPGERYVWGTKLCLEKVSGCTPDDVEEHYDNLIEQSCTAAGISAEMTTLLKKANAKKTKESCSSEITACVMNEKRCNADYRNCESDGDFDKYLSECGVESTGCESFLADVRKELDTSRKKILANADKILENIVNKYKQKREENLTTAKNTCKNDAGKKTCIESVCAARMRNKCAVGFDYEKTAAEQLCKFYDIACTRLK